MTLAARSARDARIVAPEEGYGSSSVSQYR